MTANSTRETAGPLSGITVLDLCSYLAGPYGCTLLADLGADVIKIEPPQGDMLRQFPSSLDGESRFFLGTNRGKRALALDLKQPDGLAILHRMVASTDVLVENFRPSVPARLGIDYPRLRAINPRLIYAGLTGYGDQGPLSDKGGFDQVLQCLSGMAVFQGGGADTPQLVLGSVLDYFTSALLAYGVAAALCDLIGRPELANDPRCATMRSRAAHTAELVPEVRAALAARTALEWEKLFGERVPCAAVRPIEDMFDHPQVAAEELVTT